MAALLSYLRIKPIKNTITKYLKLARIESVALVANVKPPKPKPTQKTRVQKAEERELTWEHRRMKTTTEKRVSKPNPRFAI